MNSPGAEEVGTKAQLLKDLFQHRLSPKFLAEFNPAKYGRLSVPEGQKYLTQLLAANVDKRKQILEIWQKIWTKDDWAQKITFDDIENTGEQGIHTSREPD
jgi:hypothetical protein